MRRRVALVAALAAALLGLAGAPIASAALDDQTALAKRYSPVLRVATDRECGPGEAYLPMDIDTLLGNADRRAARAVGRRRPRQDRSERRATSQAGSTTTTSTSPATPSIPAAGTCTGRAA